MADEKCPHYQMDAAELAELPPEQVGWYEKTILDRRRRRQGASPVQPPDQESPSQIGRASRYSVGGS